jgi:hypothetical protein
MNYTEQLKQVQQAITDILTGAQEASYNGKKVVKANLADLQSREKWLIQQIKLERRRGIPVRNGVPC